MGVKSIIYILGLLPVFVVSASIIDASQNVTYVAGTEQVSWYRAFILCKQSDMELASILSEDEENALNAYMNSIKFTSGTSHGYWISATRLGAGDSEFVWFSNGKPLIYKDFAPGQPDNSGGQEPCIQLFHKDENGWKWNDLGCDIKLKYVCQKSKACA